MFKNKKIVLLGCGGVGSCVLHLLCTRRDVDVKDITIIEPRDDKIPSLERARYGGATHIKERITRDNIKSILDNHVGGKDVLIDLSFGINCEDLLTWCQQNSVVYFNSAVETWEDQLIPENEVAMDTLSSNTWDREHPELYDRTLYARHIAMMNLPGRTSSTAVLEHGCNPGLVSHFMKAAFDDIIQSCKDNGASGSLFEEVLSLQSQGRYNHVAMLLKMNVVHISEIDTQTSNRAKREGEFVNTWSPMGFAEEAVDWAQAGWGTHEKSVPNMLVPSQGAQSQVFLPMHAMDLQMDSYVPNQHITGMCIPHGEAITITEHFSVEEGGATVYRPSVYYVYQCSDIAMESLEEMRLNKYVPQKSFHVLGSQDGVKGEDRVGVLLLFEEDPMNTFAGKKTNQTWSYWYGSILSDQNNPFPEFNPTVVQVAVSVLAAVSWALQNPNMGICWPDALPHKQILADSRYGLGDVVSAPMDYHPASLQFSDFRHKQALPIALAGGTGGQ